MSIQETKRQQNVNPVYETTIRLPGEESLSLSIDPQDIKDNYCVIAEAKGLSSEEAASFFDGTKIHFGEPEDSQTILTQIVSKVTRKKLLGWVDSTDKGPELGILPDKIAEICIEAIPSETPRQVARGTVIQRIDDTVIHELGHLADLQKNPQQFLHLLKRRKRDSGVGIASLSVSLPLMTSPATAPLGLIGIGTGAVFIWRGHSADRQLESKAEEAALNSKDLISVVTVKEQD